jgi:Protein of unknown function (DUF2384)
MTTAMFPKAFAGDHVPPGAITDVLRITQAELAATLGIPREAVSKSNRLRAVSVQTRLRDLIDILSRVLPWAGSPLAAYAWYRSQSLPSFGDATPEQLVREGRAEDVRAYLDRIAAGGFA